MIIINTVLILTFGILIKVHGFPAPEESTVDDQLNDRVGTLLSKIQDKRLRTFLTHYVESHSSIEQLIMDAKTVIDKLQECRPITRTELIKQSALMFGNFEACINATVDISDLEQFLLYLYKLVISVKNEAVTFVEALFNCRNQTNIFEDLECVVSAIQDQGPAINVILTNSTDLINILEFDTEDLINDLKKCLGLKKSELALNVVELVMKNC